LDFDCTTNIVEYEALILGLKESISMVVKNIHIYGDSQLILNQVNDVCNAMASATSIALIKIKDHASYVEKLFYACTIYNVEFDLSPWYENMFEYLKNDTIL